MENRTVTLSEANAKALFSHLLGGTLTREERARLIKAIDAAVNGSDQVGDLTARVESLFGAGTMSEFQAEQEEHARAVLAGKAAERRMRMSVEADPLKTVTLQGWDWRMLTAILRDYCGQEGLADLAEITVEIEKQAGCPRTGKQ